MTHYKKEAKTASEAKMKRMGLHKDHKTPTYDGFTSYDGLPGLNSGNAGQMPKGKQRFKRGGKVADVEGHKAHKNLGKKPRKAVGGGNKMTAPDTPPNQPPVETTTKPKENYGVDPRTGRGLPTKNGPAYFIQDDDDNEKSNEYAAGGVPLGSPMKRKAMVAALANRKKMAGIPSGPTPPRGPMMAIPGGYGASQSAMLPHKKGGAVKHTDEAQDKKLMHKMLNANAFKAHKADGGSMHHKDCTCKMCSGGMAYRSKKMDGGPLTAMNPMMQRPMMARPGMMQPNMMQRPGMGQMPMGRKSGGRAKYASGGSIRDQFNAAFRDARNQGLKTFEFNGKTYNTQLAPTKVPLPPVRPVTPPTSAPNNWNTSEAARYSQAEQTMNKNPDSFTPQGRAIIDTKLNPDNYYTPQHQDNVETPEEMMQYDARGGRIHRKSGGRANKTNITIVMPDKNASQQMPMPPMMPPMGGGMPPMPPMPPQMPPMGAGAPPMPPGGGAPGGGLPPQLMAALAAAASRGGGGMPMPRKTGGRVQHGMPKYQEKDYGSGSGLGRLVKKSFPTANGTE